MKNKITEIDDNVVITAEELMLEFEGYTGKILYCTEVGKQFYGGDGMGDYVIVTDDEEHPLVSLIDGLIWRNDLEGCKFIVVHSAIQIN